jgi:tetratricopeptide (TPR) repeat protein
MRIKVVCIAAIGLCLCCLLSGCGKSSDTNAGLSAYSAGNYTEAVENFQAAIINNNTNSENYIYQGMAYIALEKYENAQKDFYLALNLDAEDKYAYRGLGIASMKQEQYEEAIEFFNKAIECAGHTIGETEYDVLRYRAQAERMVEQYEASAKTYDILLQVTTPDVDLYYNQGVVYVLEQKTDLAKEDFDKAIALTPDDYQLYWNIYNCLMKSGEETLAKEYLQQTDSIQATGEKSSKYQGIVAYLLQNYTEAIEILTTLAEPDVESDLFLALAYENIDENKEAQKVYQNLIETNSNNPYVYNQTALYYLRQNSMSKALKYLKKGIKIEGNSEDSQDLVFNQIIVYERMGNYEKALEALQTYETTYGESERLIKEKEFLSQHSSE